ncbi:MAG: FAD-dependent oxidoreductase [Alphaproteobacteria bacterium]|nr:FAD-dependent oxidoreductase [Alphaproteobacteria bacterium]
MAEISVQLLILGSGPAGCTAAIYGARAGIQTVVLAGPVPGGQLTQTDIIENFPGVGAISGFELTSQMREQAESMGAEFVEDIAISADLKKHEIVLDGGDTYKYNSLIIATGATAKYLGLENEDELKGYGISTCATCDGFFYRNKTVAVVGGGNSAVEEALYLSKIAKKVYLIHRKNTLRAESALQKRLLSNEKISPIWSSKVVKYIGSPTKGGLTSVILENIIDNSQSSLDIDGIFIAIGHNPNTEIFKDQLDLDEKGFIKPIEKGSPKTNVKDVYVAGDVQEILCRQAITAAAGGCRAAMAVIADQN